MQEPEQTMSEVFGKIYSNYVWGNGVSLSGAGSDPTVVEPYVHYVFQLLKRYEITSVVDIGHGDWRMWPSDAFQGITYNGFDVAIGLSAEVQSRCGQPGRTFHQGDARTDELPTSDLVLCKDVLMHLSDADVKLVLKNLRNSPLIIISHGIHRKSAGIVHRFNSFIRSTHLRRRLLLLRHRTSPFAKLNPQQNVDIASGGYRLLDLNSAPWHFRSLGFEVIDQVDFHAGPNSHPVEIKRIWLVRPRNDWLISNEPSL